MHKSYDKEFICALCKESHPQTNINEKYKEKIEQDINLVAFCNNCFAKISAGWK